MTNDSSHPFVDQIMEVNLPLRWKPLNLERYDETTDPDEHVDVFLAQANLYNTDCVPQRNCIDVVQRTPSLAYRYF